MPVLREASLGGKTEETSALAAGWPLLFTGEAHGLGRVWDFTDKS